MSDGKRGAKAPRSVIEQEPVRPATGDAAQDDGAADPAAAAGEAGRGSGGAARGGFQDATMGLLKSMGALVGGYAGTHPHTVLYALVGFALAVLILAIGLWATIVIAVFTGAGALLGSLRDGKGAEVAETFSRLFGRR